MECNMDIKHDVLLEIIWIRIIDLKYLVVPRT